MLSTVEKFRQLFSNFFRCEIWERRDCRACRAAVVHEPESERAARIHSACREVFRCERYALGTDCPGPVVDSEYLNLIISDPQNLDPRSGKLLPVIVKQVDGRGMSVLRDGATNEEFDIAYSELRKGSDAKGQPRFFHGVCRFLSSEVRYGTDASNRRLGVYATALPSRRHHADLLAPPVPTRREREARMKWVIDKIGSNVLSVSDFREGAFLKYAKQPAQRNEPA